MTMPKRSLLLLAAGLIALPAAPALAHPHVFAEARLEVTSTGEGLVDQLRHVWRFDELFSSTVLLEFDKDASGSLDIPELEQVAGVITGSIAEFGYFQSITVGAREVTVGKVDDLRVDMVDGQMIVLFTSRPAEAVALKDGPHFAVYDPTFYTAIEFMSEAEMVLIDAPANCAGAMVVPDADEAIAANQDSLTEAFFNEPEGNDLSRIFATRLEVTCK